MGKRKKLSRKTVAASEAVCSSLAAIDKIFGKAPKKGYKFTHIEIEIIDNANFKGIDIGWVAQGVGFGHACIAWGLNKKLLQEYNQYGFYTDSEYMSDEFVKALMKAAAPKLAKMFIKNKRFKLGSQNEPKAK